MRRGISVIAVIAASLVVSLAIFSHFQLNAAQAKSEIEVRNRAIATGFALELIDALQAHSGARAIDYLKVNPFSGAMPPYFLCSHINVLDRATGKIINPDPIADLPAGNPLDTGPASERANRFYQVSVIDLTTMTLRPAPLCNQTAVTMAPLSASERLLATVTVAWKTHSNSLKKDNQVVLSALLP